MADHEPDHEVASTRERLLAAAFRMLVERGYSGATSREIARAAQVNEVTLFRVFSTKDDLLTQAIVTRAEMDRDLVPEPTGQMEADLEALATMMVRVLAGGGHLLVRILPEIRGLSEEQQGAVRQALHQSLEAYAAAFRHYQNLGQLAPNIDDHISTIFVGPILTAVLYAECWQQPVDFDVHQHVQFFLHGCSTEPRPRAPQTA